MQFCKIWYFHILPLHQWVLPKGPFLESGSSRSANQKQFRAKQKVGDSTKKCRAQKLIALTCFSISPHHIASNCLAPDISDKSQMFDWFFRASGWHPRLPLRLDFCRHLVPKLKPFITDWHTIIRYYAYSFSHYDISMTLSPPLFHEGLQSARQANDFEISLHSAVLNTFLTFLTVNHSDFISSCWFCLVCLLSAKQTCMFLAIVPEWIEMQAESFVMGRP